MTITSTRPRPSNARILWWRIKFYFTGIWCYWSHTQQRFVLARKYGFGERKSVDELFSMETHFMKVQYIWPLLVWRRYVMMCWRALAIKDQNEREGYGQAYARLLAGEPESVVARTVGVNIKRCKFEQGYLDACCDWDAIPFPF